MTTTTVVGDGFAPVTVADHFGLF